ncbi:MAG: hypothetical protein ABW169_07560 [Sphingobium sp.]
MSGDPVDPGVADNDLDRLLDRLPAPQMPDGLAARIVSNATRLPQLPPGEAPVTAIAPSPSRRRWMAWVGGGASVALAAGLATLMLVPDAARRTTNPPTPPAPSLPSTTSVAVTETPEPRAPVSRQDESAPRLAATTSTRTSTPPLPSSPAASPAPAPTEAAPLEMAERPAGDVPEAAAPVAPDDTALPDTALADGGNSGAPNLNGQAPSAQGWGYAPSRASGLRPDDGDSSAARTPGRNGPGRRF